MRVRDRELLSMVPGRGTASLAAGSDGQVHPPDGVPPVPEWASLCRRIPSSPRRDGDTEKTKEFRVFSGSSALSDRDCLPGNAMFTHDNPRNESASTAYSILSFSPYYSSAICLHAAQIFERCQRPVPGIRVRVNSCSPKGINTTAQGRDALVAHPGFQATERHYPERVAHRFGSGARPCGTLSGYVSWRHFHPGCATPWGSRRLRLTD